MANYLLCSYLFNFWIFFCRPFTLSLYILSSPFILAPLTVNSLTWSKRGGWQPSCFHWNLLMGWVSFVSTKWLVFVCSLSPSKHTRFYLVNRTFVLLGFYSFFSQQKKARGPCIHSSVLQDLICVLCSHICFTNNYITANLFESHSNPSMNHKDVNCFQFCSVKGCEYWFLALPQLTVTRSILVQTNLFSICNSTCVSVQVS